MLQMLKVQEDNPMTTPCENHVHNPICDPKKDGAEDGANTDSELLDRVIELVEDDFTYDMDCRLIHGTEAAKYTNEEAIQMAEKLGRIYFIAHRKHCGACNAREI